MSRVHVLIRPKEGILDPQGQAVERALPDEVVERTRALYEEAYQRITGDPLANWLARAGAREGE